MPPRTFDTWGSEGPHYGEGLGLSGDFPTLTPLCALPAAPGGGPCPFSLRAALRTELPWPWLSEPWVGRATSSTHTALLAMAQRFRQNRSELMTTWTCGSMTGGGGAQPCPWIPGSRCCGRPDRRHCLQLLLQGSARRCWPGASAGSPSCTWRPLSRPLALDRHGGGLPTGV